MALTGPVVSAADVEDAARLLDGRVRRTPLLPTGELSRRVGAPVLLKAESLQLTGSFKPRGAFNMLSRLPAEALGRGVVAASAGNHAQGLAFAAREVGTRATLVMPAGAPLAKIAAVQQYGGEVRLVDGSYDDAGEEARRIAAEEGNAPVPAFDAPEVVAGQGTVGLEIVRDAPALALVVVPLGGGGLAAGIAIAVKEANPRARVVGVQAASHAPYSSTRSGARPIDDRAALLSYADGGLAAEARVTNTICDGIAVKRPGALTGPLVEQWVDDVVTVSDDEVAQAMVLLLERSKLVVEGAGAVGVAALMQGRVEAPSEGDVCAVLSGGNVDASLLAECIRLGETAAGRRMVLRTVVPDRPGALARLLRVVAENGANVVDVEHLRDGIDLHVRETAIQLVLETRGRDHDEAVAAAVRAEGFSISPPAPGPPPAPT